MPRLTLSALALGLALLSVGCFDKPLPSCAFQCEPAAPSCPDGYSCRADHWCKLESEADDYACGVDILDATPADSGPIVDASVADASIDAM